MMDTAKTVQTSTSAGATTPTMTSTEPIKGYVVTMYVDAVCPSDIDDAIGASCEDAALLGVCIKNWIVDEDETPELHQ